MQNSTMKIHDSFIIISYYGLLFQMSHNLQNHYYNMMTSHWEVIRFILIVSKQPVNCIYDLDALIIAEGKTVECEYRFGIVVGEILQRRYLTIKSDLVSKRSSHLIIVQAAVFFSNEVNFRCAEFANIDFVSSAEKLKVDYIFKRESQVIVAARKKMIPDTEIDDIQLLIHFQSLLTYDIISLHRVEDERLNQSCNVIAYGICTDLSTGGSDIVRNALN